MRYTVMAALLASTFLSSPAFAAINAADFGLSQSGDNTDALQRAFDAARGSGQEVVIPAGTYSYSRQLTVDGVRVRGSSGTILAPSDPYNQRITLTGNSPSFSDVYIRYHPVARSGSDHGRNGVWVQDANNFTVSGVTFDGAAYGIPPQGQGAGDLFVYNSTDGTITNNSLSYTWADAIHITGSSRDIDVLNNRVDHSGDDGIAVVNYGGGAGDVGISGNTVTNNLWGRGITAVGASDVQITNNLISGNATDGAGVYVASEPAYNTPPPRNVLVQGNTVQDTGGAGKGHGQIMLWAGNGPLSNVTVRDNDVRNSERPDLAVVVSGPMNGVAVDGNNIDGEITRRNGGSYNDGGNSTNDGSMSNGVPVPAGTPTPGSAGTGSWTEGSQEGERDRVLSSAGNLQASCAGAQGMSNVAAAGGAISSIFSGGRATAPLQIAQIAQMVAQRVCLVEQLIEQQAMNASGTANNTAGITSMLTRILSGLGLAGFLSTETQVRDTYERQYPDAFGPMPGDDLVAADIEWADHTRNAQMAALQLQNQSVQEQAASLERARDYAAAGREGPGIRAELQASNAIQGEQIAAINSLTAATVANQRAEAEVQLRDEARKAAANATADDFMSTLATCGNCILNRPFLGN